MTSNLPNRIICFDPGETTGWSVLAYDQYNPEIIPKLVDYGQTSLWHGIDGMLLQTPEPTAVVYEAFRLFPGKAKEQIGSTFQTAQVIGVLRYLAELAVLKIYDYPAGNKVFMSDDKLKEAGVFPDVGRKVHDNRHALDSIRHGMWHLHFKRGIVYTVQDGGRHADH